jgi:hypothetical protein
MCIVLSCTVHYFKPQKEWLIERDTTSRAGGVDGGVENTLNDFTAS